MCSYQPLKAELEVRRTCQEFHPLQMHKNPECDSFHSNHLGELKGLGVLIKCKIVLN